MILTNCYQCNEETMASWNAVHPLCDSCDEEFYGWFQKQVAMFEKATENATNA